MRVLRSLVVATITLAGFSGVAGAQQSIAEIVLESGAPGEFDNNKYDFDILLKAVATAGLVDTLGSPDVELTVFAPTDFAFVRLARDLGYSGTDEAGTWDFLVGALTELGGGDPIPVLTTILTYHVVPGDVTFFDVIIYSVFRVPFDTLAVDEDENALTFQPRFFRFIDNEPDLPDPFLFVPFDVAATNGRIHTIGRVLIPIDLP